MQSSLHWSPPARVEHPVLEFARYDASEEKEVFHASPQGSCVLKHMGMRKLKKYTFCNISEKFCLVSEPGIPVKFHPCSRPWAARQSVTSAGLVKEASILRL